MASGRVLYGEELQTVSGMYVGFVFFYIQLCAALYFFFWLWPLLILSDPTSYMPSVVYFVHIWIKLKQVFSMYNQLL